MATKLALAVALLVALVALATATTYTTTVVTTSVEEDESSQQQYRQCQKQLQGRRFRSCQRYLSPRSQYELEPEEEVIEMTGEKQQPQQESLRQCCKELRNVKEPCQCAAIRHAMRQLQQQEGGQQMEYMQVYQKASNLPHRCELRTQQCQIRAIFV